MNQQVSWKDLMFGLVAGSALTAAIVGFVYLLGHFAQA